MHLDAETIRNLKEIEQLGLNRYRAVLAPQNALIAALENLQRAAEATLTAA